MLVCVTNQRLGAVRGVQAALISEFYEFTLLHKDPTRRHRRCTVPPWVGGMVATMGLPLRLLAEQNS